MGRPLLMAEECAYIMMHAYSSANKTVIELFIANGFEESYFVPASPGKSLTCMRRGPRGPALVSRLLFMKKFDISRKTGNYPLDESHALQCGDPNLFYFTKINLCNFGTHFHQDACWCSQVA